MSKAQPQWLSVDEAAEVMNCSAGHVRGLAESGSLKATNIGTRTKKRWRISIESIELYMGSRVNRKPEPVRKRKLEPVRHFD